MLAQCPARPAKPENARFHLTRDDAELAGFRPCKRCKPDRARATVEEIRFAVGSSTLGLVLVAQSAIGISALLFGSERDELGRELREHYPTAVLIADDATLGALLAQVVAFVEKPARGLNVPLDMRGTEFQRKVWTALQQIPAGSTSSYADIANEIGAPTSARAVAQACAANSLAVVVPCHRVVKSDGQLSGYRWGVERKRALLEREAHDTA